MFTSHSHLCFDPSIQGGCGGSSFSEDGLVMFAFELYFAGTDTTSNTLLTGFLYLMTHPCVQGDPPIPATAGVWPERRCFIQPVVCPRALPAGDRPGVGEEGACQLWRQTQHALHAGTLWDRLLRFIHWKSDSVWPMGNTHKLKLPLAVLEM